MSRQTILLFLKGMLKSMEDSEENLIYPIVNHSLAPVTVVWRARSWNPPMSIIVICWLSTVLQTPATAERRCYGWMLISLSVLQEKRAWRCKMCLWSQKSQIHPESDVPLQPNPLIPFSWLQRKMLATPAHGFAVSTTLYWRIRVYVDWRSPRN